MAKNITIAVLGAVAIGLLVYICVMQKSDFKVVPPTEEVQHVQVSTVSKTEVESTTFDVPELKLRFTKVPGITLHYALFNDNKSVHFYSEELVKGAMTDPMLAECAVGAFSPLTSSVVPRSQTDYQGYAQYDLGGGKYLNSQGQQAPCYGAAPSKVSLDLLDSQYNLYSQFIKSVRSY
jgi:hypothetical protein